jgi:hypothetical protein
MLRKTSILVVLLIGCSPAAPSKDNEASQSGGPPTIHAAPGAGSKATGNAVESPTPKADVMLEEFLAAPPIRTDRVEDWDQARSAKMREAKVVNKALKEQLGDASRDARSHIQYQRARIFLAVACQLVRSTAPADATDAEERAHGLRAIEASNLFFPGADEALRKSVDADGTRSPQAAQALLVLRTSSGPEDTCESTEHLWSPSR